MKNWEFQCPRTAFIELIKEHQRRIPDYVHLSDLEINELVEEFIEERFQNKFNRR